MHTAAAAAAAAQIPPGKSLPASSSPKTGDASQNAGGSSAAPGGKVKKRERTETSTEASKRERSGNGEDGDVKSEHAGEEPDKECSSNTAGGGVTGVASVEKLVTAMQQDRIEGSRKAADCASRRTVLAAAIAGTENHECLERFVQLGGVALFHEWLQEAYKGKCGEGESPKEGVSKAVEELLLTVLSALEKLPVDLQALRCQVGKSVNNLKSHKNVEIKEKARKLVETWKKRVGDEINLPAGSKSGTGHASQWSTNIKNLPVNMSASDMTGQQTGVQASNGSALSIYKSTEKGSTNQAQNNGQVWSGNAAPSALAWKEDVKNSTPPSSAANKESATPKATSWNRDKGDLPAPESGTKVVLRLPRSVSAGLNEEVFGPGSQGSSPSLPDQTTASSIADASEAKPRLQVSAAKYALPSEPVAEQNHDENAVAKPELKELERNHSGADVSRTSADTNDRAVSMAIVPVSAVSRISGSERDMGVGISARSTVVSTVDREVVEPAVDEAGAAKEEARRKDIQDAADGANCASSSSFTEMSVAGQGAAVEHKSELSSAGQDGDENSRSRLELEGLGESPEPRPSSRRSAGGDQFPGGDVLQPEKRIAARCSYEGLGRRLEWYDNSWEDKRSSYFPGKDGRKSSSEAESRKIGSEPETARVKSPDFSGKVQDIKRMDSASEFVEDDALEVAQQIAKEVEQEMETSHLSSTKDEREHLTTKEPVSSPGPILEKSCVPAEKLDIGVRVESTDNATNDDPECSTPPVQPGELAEQEHNQEPASEAAIGTAMDEEKAQPASSSNAEEEKPAEVIPQPRPDFDLNEGLGGDEGVKDVSCTPVLSLATSSAAGPTTPIPVLLKGAFIPPDSLMKAKSEPGWRGSAATSAFRPAEPRRVQETQQQTASETKDPSSSGKQPRLPLDIDLNVAETDTGFESQAISSFISKPFSEKHQQQPASTSGRVDFDLNCTDGCDNGVGLEIQVETSGLGRKTTTTRDFDLNGPVEEEPGVQHINLRSGTENTSMVPPSVTGFRLGGGAGDLPGVAAAPWFPSGNTFPAVAMPAFPMARAETSYPAQAQPFLNAGAGAIHFNVDLYRGGMTLATPAVAYPTNPPVPYPYAAGFPFASNYSFNTSAPFPASFVEAPAGSGSYPAAVSSQIGGPGSMTRFIRPHLMGIGDPAAAAAAAAPGRNDGAAWTVRPSLDLNTGPEAPEDLRPQAAGRTVALEDHLRGFGQVAAPTGKRKEPENGWEAFQAGYKQPAWC